VVQDDVACATVDAKPHRAAVVPAAALGTRRGKSSRAVPARLREKLVWPARNDRVTGRWWPVVGPTKPQPDVGDEALLLVRGACREIPARSARR
jgi:hypothetical protein